MTLLWRATSSPMSACLRRTMIRPTSWSGSRFPLATITIAPSVRRRGGRVATTTTRRFRRAASSRRRSALPSTPSPRPRRASAAAARSSTPPPRPWRTTDGRRPFPGLNSRRTTSIIGWHSRRNDARPPAARASPSGATRIGFTVVVARCRSNPWQLSDHCQR